MGRWTNAPSKRNRRDGPKWGPPSYAFVSAYGAVTVNYFLQEWRLELTVQITVMDPGGNHLTHSAAFPDPPKEGPPTRWNPLDRRWTALTEPSRPLSLAQEYWRAMPYWATRFKSCCAPSQ